MLDVTTHPVVDTPPSELAPDSEGCQAPCGSRLAWCAVHTHSQAERRAYASLHRFGFTAYLPLIDIRWADRTWHTVPLFPRYLFVQLRLDRPWSPVTYAPGVFQLVAVDGRPATCRAGAVEALQAAEAARRTRTTSEVLWSPGTPCRLDYGPYDQINGIVLRVEKERALVSLLMFGHLREVLVRVEHLASRDA